MAWLLTVATAAAATAPVHAASARTAARLLVMLMGVGSHASAALLAIAACTVALLRAGGHADLATSGY
jgi:hypothetical protein